MGVRARPGAKGLDPDRYRLVGREYLRAAPEEADSGRLAALLGLPGSPAVRPDARAVARWLDVDRRRIAGEIREDFAAGRVACLRGWRVSETEARICALVTLVCESAV